MKIGMTVSCGRISPCFPNVQLLIIEQGNQLESAQAIDTHDWQALAWGQELMRRDVSLLLCAGMDRFLRGVLHGHGIEVVCDAVGSPSEVIEQFERGKLNVHSERPKEMPHGCRREGLKGRFRKRRGCHNGQQEE